MNYPRSAYLHIPFCHRRCFYCDFPVVPLGDKASGENGPGSSSIKSYLKLLNREISRVCVGGPLSTVYIGGGTPSLLSSSQIFDLLDLLRTRFGFQSGAEITLELDPASFDKFSLDGFLNAGVNRLSLGAQSFNDKVLFELGRRHTSKDLHEACTLVNESFLNGKLFSWSLDLIQNLPGQDLLSWKEELLEALDFSPPHLSVYDLSIEKGTVFALRQKKGDLILPTEELAFDISRLTSEVLKEFGYSRYEISNYAFPGHASRHNRVYWSGASWWGFGQGATSCLSGKRFSRPRTREGYEKWLNSKEFEREDQFFEVSDQDQLIPLDDLFIVGLRRREGIDLRDLLQRMGWNEDLFQQNIANLKKRWNYQIEMGWIKQRGSRFYLSDPCGMEISNQILVEMLLWWDSVNDYSCLESRL